MANGNYRIEIAVTKGGMPIIGASDVKQHSEQNNIDDLDLVYGIQIGHRCAVPTERGWRIMTPTEAKRLGHTEITYFPQAKRR